MKQNNHIKEALSKQHACYVLITCDEPSEDGNIQVEMSHQGDTSLISYLIQGAQSYIDDQEEEELSY
ncbi:hypothetical protein BN1013_01528 [Candidatus Rubidus massiliensis]|nr:hypothetical protein BN1013_01528 [Candidatus Rubidus massiliensis]